MSTGKLSFKEKVGYALGDSASNFYWKVFEFYILFFYTDVFGLTPLAAGYVLLFTRIWDAIIDPVVGAIADRTKSRWGSFRPYLIWFSIPIWAAGVVMFTTPDADESGKLIYAYVTYMFMMTMYAAINIPYSALMGVMTGDTQERAQLSSFRFIGAFAVALIVQTYTKRLVSMIGGGNEQHGWQMVMVLYGAIAAVMFLACFWLTQERVPVPKEQKSDIKADVNALLKNGPYLTMFFMGMLVIAGFALRGGTLLYYFKYYVNRGDAAFESFMVTGGLAALAGSTLMPLGTKLLGKKKLYVVCMAGAGLLTLPYYFLPAESWGAIFTLNILISFLLGPTAPLIFVMFTDVADYGEWKLNRRTTGLIMAAAMLSLKFGGAIGGFVNGKVLDMYHFVANQDQSPEAIQGILLLMGLIPAATTIGAAILAMTYKLDDNMMKQIESDLLARRQQQPQ